MKKTAALLFFLAIDLPLNWLEKTLDRLEGWQTRGTLVEKEQDTDEDS